MQLNSKTIVELSINQTASNSSTTELRFRNKNIESIEAGVFNRYKSLEILNLSGNKIKELPQGIFNSLKKLKNIYLSSNKISSLHPQLFKENKKLELIDVAANEITDFNEKELFKNLPELKKLGFNENKIKTFNFECLNGSTKLEVLWFENNDLREIKDLDNLKKLFPKLRVCRVGNNHFNYSYMERVVESLERQNIIIQDLDKSKGILLDSVFGLKCVPDDVNLNSSQGLELERKVSDTEAKLEQLSVKNTELVVQLTNSNKKINGLEAALAGHQQQNSQLSGELKDTREEMRQLIGELQRQQAMSDAELKTLQDQLTKSNRKINGLDAVLDVHDQQNWKLSKYFKEAKEEMRQLTGELQRQQARCDAELKSLCEKTDVEATVLRTSIQTSWSTINNSINAKMRSFYSLSGEIFELDCDFEIFSDNFKKYNEKIETQIRKYEGQITEWAANMETTMKEMHQVMEDHKMSFPRERPLIWEKLKQLEEHGIKNQEGVDGLRADFEEYSEEYAKQKTQVGDRLNKCEINLDALQTEMAERGDEMTLLYKTERTKILTSLVELKRISDNLLADKELRALADDNKIE